MSKKGIQLLLSFFFISYPAGFASTRKRFASHSSNSFGRSSAVIGRFAKVFIQSTPLLTNIESSCLQNRSHKGNLPVFWVDASRILYSKTAGGILSTLRTW